MSSLVSLASPPLFLKMLAFKHASLRRIMALTQSAVLLTIIHRFYNVGVALSRIVMILLINKKSSDENDIAAALDTVT